jgi:hypothetical protein
MAKETDRLYLLSVLVLMFVLPVVSILVEIAISERLPDLWDMVGKWFVFWAVGVRFVTAAIRQVANPSFTAKEIFRIDSRESDVIVRELGFANFCMGLVGILSFLMSAWRTAAALDGGLYLGLAGLQHILKKPARCPLSRLTARLVNGLRLSDYSNWAPTHGSSN